MKAPPRFYSPQLASAHVVLDAAESRHALHSLRLQPGDAAELFDGRGTRARGAIVPALPVAGASGKSKKAERGLVTVQIDSRTSVPPPARLLTLIVAGCKGPRLDWLVEKCTELGVTKLSFARFERSVVVPGEGHLEKLRRTAIEACKQCGRDWLPEIAAGEPLDAAVAAARAGGAALFVAHAGDDSTPAARLFQTLNDVQSPRTAAVIGPEGGLTEAELRLLFSAGGKAVRLATDTLRVETAAICVAACWAAG